MNEIILIPAIICGGGLILSAWVTCCVMKSIKDFGSDNKGKRLTVLKSLFNFYAVLLLAFVILVRALTFIDNQLFIGLFVIILSGLGFKVGKDALEKP